MNLESILRKASLNLEKDSRRLVIKSKFFLFNSGNLGLLFFFLVSLFLFYISIFEAKEIIIQIILILLSVIVLVFTILAIYKQVNDFIEVNQNVIKFSNNLKTIQLSSKSNFKIKIRTNTIKTKTYRYSSGSYFYIVELFLKTNDRKYRILDFQVDEKDKYQAKILGKEIKRMILEITNKV